MIPAGVAPYLGNILGLSTITGVARPHFRAFPLTGIPGKSAAANPKAVTTGPQQLLSGGTGPGGSLAPADIKTLYGLNSVTLDGAGQTVALFELDGYNPADITRYASAFNLPAPALTFAGSVWNTVSPISVNDLSEFSTPTLG